LFSLQPTSYDLRPKTGGEWVILRISYSYVPATVVAR
jgi:hypothetical protein